MVWGWFFFPPPPENPSEADTLWLRNPLRCKHYVGYLLLVGRIFGGVHPGSEGVLIASAVLFPVLVPLFTLYGLHYLLRHAGRGII
jgi:hypothetical protein